MRRPLASVFFGGVALLGVACGSDAKQDAPAPPPPEPTSSAEVLARCRGFAERLCAGAEGCCTSTFGEYSEADCVAGVLSTVCEPSAQLVAAERAVYDVAAEEPCLAAQARSHESCVADWEEIVAIRRDVWTACKVIRGTVREGGTCTTASMCAQPDGPATSICSAGVCRVLRLLGSGEACPYPLGDVSVCDVGLYCTAVDRDAMGTCEPVTLEGDACDPIKLNQECGLGHYCDLSAAVCRKATNFGGPSCEQGPECVSFLCDGVTHVCSEPLSTVNGLCGGA